MHVITRSGAKKPMRFDVITDRNIELARGLDINIEKVSQLVIKSLKDGITTSEIDELSAETAFCMSVYHPDYDILASRISINNLHKRTHSNYKDVLDALHNVEDATNGTTYSLLNEDFYNFSIANIDKINAAIKYERDYDYSYFAFKTLLKSYLLRVNSVVVERPQHMLMRVALDIHGPTKNYLGNIDKALETYECLSTGKYIHATPTLFHSGCRYPQKSSCFVIHLKDSTKSIYHNLYNCSIISKNAGGIGLSISEVRPKNSIIRSNGYTSDGIVPMLKVYDDSSVHIRQGGKRNGAYAVYLEPWHPEISEFLKLRDNTPPEHMRTRNLFTGLWIPDLFMRRVESGSKWSLFDPSIIRRAYDLELSNIYGEEFEKIYIDAENKKLFEKQVNAKDLWSEIVVAQSNTGLPYMLYKDSVNRKSNQKNIGVIKSSNLCTEILEYTDGKHISVCNLASIALPKFVIVENGETKYNYEELGKITRYLVENLNNVIDTNYYPIESAKNTNLEHRPIGIGVQGLADVFFKFKCAWDSDKAKELNRLIFETIYYNAVFASAELAIKFGSYSKFEGSPISQGILSPDMWNDIPYTDIKHEFKCPKYDWDGLREKCKKGMRNSLLVAPMPTATTSNIMGNVECIEPLTSNIYARKVLAGDFPVVNKYLYEDLKGLGLWNKKTVNNIIKNDGSVKDIDNIPDDIKKIYRTVWEYSQKVILDLAADRAPYIDQNQSLNVFFEHPTNSKLSSLHFYGWHKGLKSTSYYVKSKQSRPSIKFSIIDNDDFIITQNTNSNVTCNEEVCTSCSS